MSWWTQLFALWSALIALELCLQKIGLCTVLSKRQKEQIVLILDDDCCSTFCGRGISNISYCSIQGFVRLLVDNSPHTPTFYVMVSSCEDGHGIKSYLSQDFLLLSVQRLSVLNLLDITSKFLTVAMFVTVDLNSYKQYYKHSFQEWL